MWSAASGPVSHEAFSANAEPRTFSRKVYRETFTLESVGHRGHADVDLTAHPPGDLRHRQAVFPANAAITRRPAPRVMAR